MRARAADLCSVLANRNQAQRLPDTLIAWTAPMWSFLRRDTERSQAIVHQGDVEFLWSVTGPTTCAGAGSPTLEDNTPMEACPAKPDCPEYRGLAGHAQFAGVIAANNAHRWLACIGTVRG